MPAAPSDRPPPVLDRSGPTATLRVDGAPFLLLGGELHNSSASTPEAIGEALARVAALGANTVLAPATWQDVEPVEGRFDFTLVDELLRTARATGLRVVLLWFGAYKNGQSTYVPDWVKTDTSRFPRAHAADGPLEVLSPFAEACARADARAFAALMGHLRAVDGEAHTVVMVQVENEVGLLTDARDRGPEAERAWEAPVPLALVTALHSADELAVRDAWVARGRPVAGGWRQVLGESPEAEEAFMAHAFASALETVAAAGRAEHDVPLFANAWLDAEIDVPALAVAGGQRPGVYPSGGPLPRVAALWRAVAPSLDLLAPDLYFGDADAVFARFARASGGLLVPEMRRDAVGVGHAVLALGSHGALGVSPFGVDSFEPGDEADLQDLYGHLRTLAGVILAHSGAPTMAGVALGPEDGPRTVRLGDWAVTVQRHGEPWQPAQGGRAHALVVEEEPGVFLLAGRGFRASFAAADGGRTGLLSVHELRGGPAGLEVVRTLNGDETLAGTGVAHPPRVPVTQSSPIPSVRRTSGITRARPYRF